MMVTGDCEILTMSSAINISANKEILRLGDHPALDFLNTVARIGGTLVDSLKSDHDVVQWLAQAGWPLVSISEHIRLLDTARHLREIIRALVLQRKSGMQPDVTDLNVFLSQSRSHLELESDAYGNPGVKRVWEQHTAIEALAPLAESAADLVANGDFSLVRHCEDSECVLWFYDRTKSHHRRWCSMAACGNRNKVAAFRKRQQPVL
jgi:predicted RNA-binding Zn ribbon-like protein